jgi:hypothetical protein
MTISVCLDVPFVQRYVRSVLALRVAAIALTFGNYLLGLGASVGRERFPDIGLLFGEFSIGVTPYIPFVVFVGLH